MVDDREREFRLEDMGDGEIRIGDLVRARSGGPLMAVIDVCGNEVACVWFDRDGAEQRGTWRSEALQREAWEEPLSRIPRW